MTPEQRERARRCIERLADAWEWDAQFFRSTGGTSNLERAAVADVNADALRAVLALLAEPDGFGVRNRVGMWTTVYATAEAAQDAIDEIDRAHVVALLPVREGGE